MRNQSSAAELQQLSAAFYRLKTKDSKNDGYTLWKSGDCGERRAESIKLHQNPKDFLNFFIC